MRMTWNKSLGLIVLLGMLVLGALAQLHAAGPDFQPIVQTNGEAVVVRGLVANDATAATSNTVKIQAAINNCIANGGGTVVINAAGVIYVTTGTDATAQAMTFPPCLYINGSNVAIKLGDATIIRVAAATNRYPVVACIGTTGTHYSNITLAGGEWDGNAANQTFAVDDNRKHMMHFYHVDNLRVEKTKIWPGAGNPTNQHFSINGWDLGTATFEDLELTGSEATIRIISPATDLRFQRIRSSSPSDACISLGIADHASYLPSGYAGGDIRRVVIRDIAITGPGRIQLYRVDPGSLYQSNKITDVLIDGVQQTYSTAVSGSVIQLGGISDVPGTSIMCDRITVRNVSGTGAYLVYTGGDSGSLGDVTIENVNWTAASGLSLVPLNFTVCPVQKLTLNNVKVTNSTATVPVLGINRVDNLVMNDVILAGTGVVSPVFYAANGTVGATRADIRNLEIGVGTGTGSVAIYRNATTAAQWSINGFYVHSGTAVGIGVFQDQSSSGATWNIALNGLFRESNVGLTINLLNANSNVRFTGYCSHVLEGSNYAEFGYHGAGGTLSLDNAGMHLIARDGAADQNPNGALVNDRFFNTDAGLTAGVGPVIVTANSAGSLTIAKNGR